MPREFSRAQRIGDQIQRELADLVRRELDDPRLSLVTMSGVEVSRDLAHAKVYVSTLSDRQGIEEVLEVLNKMAGFLRHHLGRRMSTRTVPELRFVQDRSIEEGFRIDRLIEEAVASDRHDEEEQDD